MSRLRGYPSLDRGNRVRPDARPERRRRVHPHRLHAEDRAALEPPLGDLDAFLAQRLVRARQIRRRVVRDVLALDARSSPVRGQLVEPLPARRAHRIEAAAASEHAVVGDVAEQPREEIHVRHAGKVVLRELREVEHGDLAILLLHLRGRQPATGLAPSASAAATPAAARRRPRLEDLSDRPRARRDAGQLVLLGSTPPCAAAGAASFPVNTSPAALRPAPAVLKNPRRSSPPFVSWSVMGFLLSVSPPLILHTDQHGRHG